jgi:hypothetical protein
MMTTASDAALVHSMGQNGFEYLTTAGTATYASKKMCAIQCLADSTITCVSVRGDSLTAVPILAGTVIVGEFSSVTVAGTGGAALAYLAERL